MILHSKLYYPVSSRGLAISPSCLFSPSRTVYSDFFFIIFVDDKIYANRDDVAQPNICHCDASNDPKKFLSNLRDDSRVQPHFFRYYLHTSKSRLKRLSLTFFCICVYVYVRIIYIFIFILINSCIIILYLYTIELMLQLHTCGRATVRFSRYIIILESRDTVVE